MAAKRKTLWQILAAQLLLVAVPLYGLAPELSALASSRGDWESKTRLRVSSSALENQPQAHQPFHPDTASGDSFHAEAIGTIRALTNEAGEVTDRYTLEAFGTLLSHEGTDPNQYLFAGEPLDPNSGFYYNRARWLEPDIGRFASVDPFGGSIEDPRTLQKYLYAAGNPALLLDPTGLDFGSLAGQLVTLSVKSLVASIVQSLVFRAAETALKVARGADLGAAVSEAALGVLTDTVFSLVIPGVGAYANRIVRLRSVGQALSRAVGSVWNLPPFLRGRHIENIILGGRAFWSRHTIDYFGHGVAVSVKSIDVTARSYQSAAALMRKLAGYAKQLQHYTGDLTGVPPIFDADIRKRVLVVAIEDGAATIAQGTALREFLRRTSSEWPDVIIKLVPIK